MANRNTFAGEIYHIYNRGVDKRVIFPDDSFYNRFKQMLRFYLRYDYRFSIFLRTLHSNGVNTSPTRVAKVIEGLEKHKWEIPPVELISFCLMPNHYHLQVKQLMDNGVPLFMHRLGTGFTHYFNMRNERSGHLFEGGYKVVRTENEGQLLCLNRYIHINPISAGLVKLSNLSNWKWSSLPEYLNDPKNKDKICKREIVLGNFKGTKDYLDFVLADSNNVEKQSLEGISLDDDFGWFEEREESKRKLQKEALDRIMRT